MRQYKVHPNEPLFKQSKMLENAYRQNHSCNSSSIDSYNKSHTNEGSLSAYRRSAQLMELSFKLK